MKKIVIVLILTLTFGLGITHAQDIPTPTPEPTPIVIVTPAPAPSDEIAITAAQLLAYIVLSVAAGGGILAIVYRALDNRNVQDIVEKTYESWNPETQQIIKDVLAGYKTANERFMTFLEKVTDGLPNAQAVVSSDQVRSIVRSEMLNIRDPETAKMAQPPTSNQGVGQ